jgi:hypothetical protein
MKKYIALMVLLFSSFVFAQVDTAIIATDAAAVDMLSARAAANKIGAPIFIAEGGLVGDDILQTLADNGITKVIIVGGPAVVKEEAKAKLENAGYDVTRLWGIERTGTALEIAKYFWPEGASCVTLVDDTKNSDFDNDVQLEASDLASRKGCILVPVPKDTLPADVLSTLDDLKISEVKFVGRELTQDMRLKLQKYKIDEITGSNDEIGKEVEDELAINSTKLIVVAAPNWKHTLGIGSNPEKGTVVKKISSIDQNTRLITFINDHSFSEVKVVGSPDLADEISTVLADAGITVSKVTDAKPNEIAKKIWQEKKEEWNEIKKKHEEARIKVKIEIKSRIRGLANDTESALDELEIQLEDSEKSGTNVSVLRSRLLAARQRITDALLKIDTNEEEAKSLIAKAKNDFEAMLWVDKDRIKWDIRARIKTEEAGLDEIERDSSRDITDLESNLARLKRACNSDLVEDLVEKAKSLKNIAKEESDKGNHARVAEIRVEVKKLVDQAKRVGSICEKGNVVSDRIQNLVEKGDDRSSDIVRKIDPLKVENIRRIRPVAKISETPAQDVPPTKTGSSVKEITDTSIAGTAPSEPSAATTDEAAAVLREFKLEADDNGFYRSGSKISSIEVNKGDKVRITFSFRDDKIYFGGLDITSSSPSTSFEKVSYSKGGSSKTVEFTADSTIRVDSFWPASGVKKSNFDIVVK